MLVRLFDGDEGISKLHPVRCIILRYALLVSNNLRHLHAFEQILIGVMNIGLQVLDVPDFLLRQNRLLSSRVFACAHVDDDSSLMIGPCTFVDRSDHIFLSHFIHIIVFQDCISLLLGDSTQRSICLFQLLLFLQSIEVVLLHRLLLLFEHLQQSQPSDFLGLSSSSTKALELDYCVAEDLEAVDHLVVFILLATVTPEYDFCDICVSLHMRQCAHYQCISYRLPCSLKCISTLSLDVGLDAIDDAQSLHHYPVLSHSVLSVHDEVLQSFLDHDLFKNYSQPPVYFQLRFLEEGVVFFNLFAFHSV